MAGHVPKYGAHNGVDFSEVFTQARTGGKRGLGDSGGSQEDQQRQQQRNPRGGAGDGPAGGAARRGVFEKEGMEPQRRGSASHERETSSTRSPLETNRSAGRESSGRGGGGRGGGGGHDSSSRSGGGRKPRNINEEYAAASHLPKFGDWNTSDPSDANYTVMFSAASKERQTGSAGDLGSKTPGKGSGDLYKSSSGLPKKQSSSWWCFS